MLAAVAFLILGSLLVVAPRAAASWCGEVGLAWGPTSGTAGTQVTFSFRFDNFATDIIDVSDASVSYSWGPSSDFGAFTLLGYGTITLTSTQTLPSVATTGTLFATLQGTSYSDPTPTTCTSSAMLVTVNPSGPVTASASVNRTVTDVGIAVGLTCTETGGYPPFVYTWDFGDGQTGSGSTVTHAYSGPGVWTATCIVRDGSGSASQAEVAISVDPLPTVLIPPAPHMAQPGTPLVFNATASGGTGRLAYTWDFGDGSNGTGENLSHAYGTAGNYTAVVHATDGVGGAASASIPVEITLIAVTAGTSRSSAAPGDVVSFSASAVGGAGSPYAFAWDFGDGTNGTGPFVSHAYSNPGTYTPRVTVTDALGGRDTKALPAVTIQGLSQQAVIESTLAIGVVSVAVVGVTVLLLRRHRIAVASRTKPPTPRSGPRPPHP